MTYTLNRYQSYQDYLDDEQRSSERNYRLLNTGELIEVPPEDDDNTNVAFVLGFSIARLRDAALVNLVRPGTKEIQVKPIGDKRVNRKPDLLVLHPEHRDTAKQAILLGMLPPLFVAEVVSPGPETSDNYRRDYDWKRRQYEQWGIPEYWIIDPVRAKVTVLVLEQGHYREEIYQGEQWIESSVFPKLRLQANSILIA